MYILYLEYSFEPLEQTYDVFNQVQEWMARKSSSQQSSHQSIVSICSTCIECNVAMNSLLAITWNEAVLV